MQADEEFHLQSTAVTLMKFLTMQDCPPDWRHYDLYLFRDEEAVFYVGQSQNAFKRVWDHLLGGPKGRSTIGRFVLCNWPKSMRFMIELMSSRSVEFEPAGKTAEAAERYLIARLSPCLNEAANQDPTPLPEGYLPPNVRIRQVKSLKRMIREAEYAARQEGNPAEWR